MERAGQGGAGRKPEAGGGFRPRAGEESRSRAGAAFHTLLALPTDIMLQFLVSGASEDRALRSPRPLGVPGRQCTALESGLEPVVASRVCSCSFPLASS